MNIQWIHLSNLSANALKPVIQLLDLYIQTLDAIIKLEKEVGKPIKELMTEVLKPESLEEVSKLVPPETLGKLFRALISMAQISPKINKFLELSIDEKEAVAEDVKRVERDLEEFVDMLKRSLSDVKQLTSDY
ncbi:hypothetical protein Igag_1424 [Ignisphaera aggregans DSM 17230]|uniref:Uncharacterized protein n=1 Tax=Ignisphaera aggregans (strain DSM 17230 / JCM 13409 / AQ1.S1) TaxID=583356 RepID=E0SQH1_IGNAA|nr:hypothetical protein Igag_1424 [Ignisphaera aggregans DSM 17230]